MSIYWGAAPKMVMLDAEAYAKAETDLNQFYSTP